MALFSDIDWLIILGVGVFLLFGHEGGATVRQLGRWYGRAMRLKQELVSEVARAADLPMPPGASGGSLRAVLLGTGLDADARAQLSIPLVGRGSATEPARPLPPPSPAPPIAWTGGTAVTSWTTTFFEPTDRDREAP